MEKIEVKIFNSPDSTTATETLTSTGAFSTLVDGRIIRIGESLGTAEALTYWMDNVLINDTGYPGPAGGGGPTLRVNRGAMMW